MKRKSTVENQFLYRQADITGDLPEQRGSEITTLVNRNRRPPDRPRDGIEHASRAGELRQSQVSRANDKLQRA